MDIVKILLLYMAMNVTGTAQQAPDLTPPPVTPAPVVEQVQMTPAPAASEQPVEEVKKYATLRPGNDGQRVKEMQEKLIELGFLEGKADGQYGPKTKQAVSAYQKQVGLKVDGVAGNDTLSRLYSAQPLSTPTPAPSVMPAVMVSVYYMDQDTNTQLHAMTITCYGSTTIYANSNHVPGEYHLVSESSAQITVENNIATPSAVTFYYSALETQTPAPAQTPAPTLAPQPDVTAPADEKITLAPAGTHVLLNGESKQVPWFEGEDGNVWLLLNDAAGLLGSEAKKNERFVLLGKTVLFTYDENGLYSITVEDALCTEDGLYQNEKTYIRLSFLEKIGCHVEITEGIPDISLPAENGQ